VESWSAAKIGRFHPRHHPAEGFSVHFRPIRLVDWRVYDQGATSPAKVARTYVNIPGKVENIDLRTLPGGKVKTFMYYSTI
jgi:hypothetical protein